ncbi:LOW QUALITY PROTEIN: nucleosome-remodeling factor subunit BPTF-like [Dermacentor silvarum]|uniref:LOW QUALITY PROTEIN: nucleosome-remodeling factor subunit BPTF-like n=1 Tax=Dermacentor silvarum TaxID=543639 RepID=UPI00210079E3|nr:LOW QUALITY PROTEIN: nucleosome-remodeling factor subunit BPTF-like [Dermacentor silvarum]
MFIYARVLPPHIDASLSSVPSPLPDSLKRQRLAEPSSGHVGAAGMQPAINPFHFLVQPSLLKKPRYLYAGSSAQSSRLGLHLRQYENSTPQPQLKQRLREKSQKVRSFIQTVLGGGGDDEDNDLAPPPSSGDESDYQRAEDEEDDDDGSVASYESDDVSVYSQSSYSTISSTTPAKRKWTSSSRRAHSPVFLQERELPALPLPKSSEDLILPTCHIMRALSIYETLRHFRNILRLTPFRFEDFCVALMSDEQSALLSEAHIALLRAILREEEAAGTQFGPQDLKDSINVHLYMVDAVTWPAVLRMYLTSDPEYRPMLAALERCEYPFTAVASKLNVLEFLCDQFLTTAQAREDITSEGGPKHDDHCRVCHKLGDLLCCETCPAVYHLACLDPPLEDVPTEDWICTVCQANQVSGVTDCISDIEKGGLLSRQECLGLDRHGRKYWFLCRRIFVEGENNEAFYYSTPAQLEELLDVLDAEDLELDLCRTIAEFRDEIVRHMELTEKLTNSSKGNRKTYLDSENATLAKVQAERAARRAREEEERKQREAQEAEERRRLEEENAALAAANLESAAHRFLNSVEDSLLMPCPLKPEDGLPHFAEMPQMVEEEMNVASHANILDMGGEENRMDCGEVSDMPPPEPMEVDTKPDVTEMEEEVTTTTMVTTVVTTTTTSTKTVTMVKLKEEGPDDMAEAESKAAPETKESEEKEAESEQCGAKADDGAASAAGKKPSEEDSAKKAAGKGTGKEEPDIHEVSCRHFSSAPFGCSSLEVPTQLVKSLRDHITVSPAGVAFVKPSIRRGLLSQMLDEVLGTRIMVKKAMSQSTNKGLRRVLDAQQLSLKLIANVTYGYTSAGFSGRMPCVEVADSVVSKGREALEHAIRTAEAIIPGARVVYGDTDSLFVLMEGRSREEAFRLGQEIADRVTAQNPRPMRLKLEKVYQPCVLQTKKRYVGFAYESPDQQEPKYDAKGIETVRRDTCPAVAKVRRQGTLGLLLKALSAIRGQSGDAVGLRQGFVRVGHLWYDKACSYWGASSHGFSRKPHGFGISELGTCALAYKEVINYFYVTFLPTFINIAQIK